MRRTLIVLTSAAVLALSLVAGSLVWATGMPDVHALSLMDPIGRMHNDGHGQMHRTGDHQQMHAKCVDASGEHHSRMTDDVECPHGEGMAAWGMGHMLQGNHHMQGHQAHADGCPMIEQDS